MIPTDARATMIDLREGVSEEEFLDHVWNARDRKQGPIKPVTGVWPCKPLAVGFNRLALADEARVQVEKLPTRLRGR